MTALPAAATKAHLDAATDDPKQARTELAALVDKFNDMRGYATGLLGTDGLPATGRTTLGLGSAAVEDVAAGGIGDLLRADGDGSALTGLSAGPIPSGTRMLFHQTAAPTGWTKDASAGLNNNALRIVTGAASNGGNSNFTTVFGASKNTGAHALTVSEMPGHTHTLGYNIGVGGFTGNATVANANNSLPASSGGAGGGAAHSHTLSLDLKYQDVIVASKDA